MQAQVARLDLFDIPGQNLVQNSINQKHHHHIFIGKLHVEALELTIYAKELKKYRETYREMLMEIYRRIHVCIYIYMCGCVYRDVDYGINQPYSH